MTGDRTILITGVTGKQGGAVALLTFVTLAASYIPAFRASRLEPMKALRYE